LTVYVFVRNT